jgi:hypothetical protein
MPRQAGIGSNHWWFTRGIEGLGKTPEDFGRIGAHFGNPPEGV